MKFSRAFIVLCLGGLSADASAQPFQSWSKLIGTGAVGGSLQGRSVALSSDGNIAIVGGYGDNGSAGAAWVFTRSGGAWNQQGTKLVGSGAVGTATQGFSVALSSDGNTAIVGGYSDNGSVGAAWIFTRSGGAWNQQGPKLVGTGAVGASQQGISVGISSDGNTAIVGGLNDNASVGAAWVFTRTGGNWTQEGAKLVGTGAVGTSAQGRSVALSSDGNTAIVGGINDDSGAGAAWIFTRIGGAWNQQGPKLVGTGAVGNAAQGISVALSSDGNTAIVGGFSDNASVGAVWVFTRGGGVWTQQGDKLVGTGAVGFPRQGISAAISSDGNTAMVGGYGDDGAVGASWIFTRSGGVWTQQGNKLVGKGAVGLTTSQGVSVSLAADGKTAIVGGYRDNNLIGAAWIFSDATSRIASVEDVAFDQGGAVVVNWDKSGEDRPPSTLVNNYLLWRGIRASSLPGNAYALGRAEYVDKVARGESTASTYMTNTRRQGSAPAPGEIYWQYIASLPSHSLARYSYACPTLADSTTQGIPWRYFFITAATDDPDLYWDSPPDSGYSTDNLAPHPPAHAVLASIGDGRVRLFWDPDRMDSDLGQYVVYRSATSGFPVADTTRLVSTMDTTIVDSSISAGTTYYYRITAVDVHGNESVPTEELASTVNTISRVVIPDHYELSQNYPNPFNPATTIRYGLPSRSHVTLAVFNTLGQHVATLVQKEQEPGYHEVEFDASRLPSGVYLYRLLAGEFVETRKVLLLR